MVLLKIISGPNRGSVYPLKDGEHRLGREGNNEIVLSSSQVSKTHCRLVVSHDHVEVIDQQSSNGTFCNGVQIKEKKLKSGDQIGVGPFVLELKVKKTKALQVVGDHPASEEGAVFSGNSEVEPDFHAPKSLPEKFHFFVERFLLPPFYQLNFKNELTNLWMVFAFVGSVGAVAITVYPLIQASEKTLVQEFREQASFQAKVWVEQNREFILEKQETRIQAELLRNHPQVKAVYMLDLEQKILFPSEKINQYLASGEMSNRVHDYLQALKQKQIQKGVTTLFGESYLLALEPVWQYSARFQENIPIAVAVLAWDYGPSLPGGTILGIAYSEIFLFVALFLGFLFFVLYKINWKPVQVMTEDFEKGLKGEISEVTKVFQVNALQGLRNLLNSALNRIPQNEEEFQEGGFSGKSNFGIESSLEWLQKVSDSSKSGMVSFSKDRLVLSMNQTFEEITGIRASEAMGSSISQIARDQSFQMMAEEIFSHLDQSDYPFESKIEFSGLEYKITAFRIGSMGNDESGSVFWITREDE